MLALPDILTKGFQSENCVSVCALDYLLSQNSTLSHSLLVERALYHCELRLPFFNHLAWSIYILSEPGQQFVLGLERNKIVTAPDLAASKLALDYI